MTSGEEFTGVWWLPGQRDETERVGTLKVEKGRPKLELVGDFGFSLLDESERQKRYSLDLAEHPRIHGWSTKGKPITLEGHVAAPYEVHLPGISTSTYIRQAAVVGRHFDAGEKIAFDEIAIEVSDLNEWSQVSGFELHLNMEKDEVKDYLAFSDLSIKFTGPEALEFDLGRGASATIKFRVDSKGLSGRSTRIEMQQRAALYLRLGRRLSLDDVFERVMQVRNLLSLAVARPVSVLKATGFRDDHLDPMDNAMPIGLYWEVAYNPDPPKSQRLPHEMLFALPEASPDFDTVARSWFAKQTRLAPVFDLFFGVRHNPNMALEVRFLAYAQALETYDYRRRRKPSKDSLAERVKAVLGLCKTVARRITDSETEAFVRSLVNSRNYYTHYNPRFESRAAKGVALYLLFVQLQAVLEMALLRELGFGCRAIDAQLERIRRYSEIEHFRQLTAEEENSAKSSSRPKARSNERSPLVKTG